MPTTLIVRNDPTATANAILANESLFRLGFAGYLLEGLCDAALSLIPYVLLKPVHRNLSLLAAFFGLISTAHFAVCQMFFFCALLPLKSPAFAQSFSREQLNALPYRFVRIYAYGAGLLMVFYGSASIIRGYLIYRSGYLPRFIGVLLGVAGAAFIVKNFTLVLASGYSSDFLLLPAPLAVIALTVWFLWKGVDIEKWNARVAAMGVVNQPSLI